MSEGEYWIDESLCDNAGLDSGNIWITGEGKYIHIEKLTDEHLVNIIKMIKSNCKEKDYIQYENLMEELRVRGIDLSKQLNPNLEPLIGKHHAFRSIYENDYDLIRGFIKEDVKSAVKFCKRYIYNWNLLKKEKPKIAKMCEHLYSEEEYNKWLIDYCFSDVAYGCD